MFSKEIFFLTFSILLFSCSSESNPIIHFEENGKIYPLEIGNKWVYKQIYFDKNSKPIDTSNVSIEIGSSYEKDGQLWFSRIASWWQYSNQVDGLWTKHTQAPSEAIPYLEYKYPTYEGEKYSNFNVISVNKIIKIGLGYFRTIQYRFSIDAENEGYTDSFLSPGIGLIKFCKIKRNIDCKPYIAMEQELLSYDIK